MYHDKYVLCLCYLTLNTFWTFISIFRRAKRPFQSERKTPKKIRGKEVYRTEDV